MGCGSSKNNKQEEIQDNSDLIPERKVLVVGDPAVGKSAIIYQFVSNGFTRQTPTVGVKN